MYLGIRIGFRLVLKHSWKSTEVGYGYRLWLQFGKWFVDVKDCFILLFPILYPVTLYHVKGMSQHLRQIHDQMKVQTIVAINRRIKLVGFRFREIYFTRENLFLKLPGW